MASVLVLEGRWSGLEWIGVDWRCRSRHSAGLSSLSSMSTLLSWRGTHWTYAI